MAEPTTANTGFIVPNTGDLSGAWGTSALNPNFQLIDGRNGGVLNLSFSAATTITLTTTTASFTPGAGPFQSDNAAIVLAGTLSGNGVIKLTMPGVYRVQNNCVTGGFYIQLAPASGTGNAIGAPNGEFRRVFFDGTNVSYLDLPHVGMLLDFCTATTPVWFNACTVKPYLLCNGATFSSSVYPALNAYLGSTYGGNGVSTFGVPDFQNRYFIPMDFGGNLRITVATAGIDGTAFGATGGDQRLQSHQHANTLNDAGHSHGLNYVTNGWASGGGTAGFITTSLGGTAATTNTNNATTGITISNATTGVGSSGNIPPGIVGGMRFIKT